MPFFSGRSEAGYQGNEGSYEYFSGNKIHIFDWSGNLIRKVSLDTSINKIYFDNTSGHLYGMKLYDNYALVKFDL